ncbi:DUF2889 domain-containing protein [Hydrogenophaga sp.]|uniref:DUF2889 domain-containing protein n=1 Tax=Hydrogenophaga sp. TaxID=1904254 RepID=UPI00262A5E18|nr:DUF2889 domain-containing protein [Hydrogenophaga sp.]MCW5653415.1 DUF2889 domain-containing protein [Hydrogenophaga sp.]
MRELPPPKPRAPLHTRQVTCTGWLREDGLWEVEGRLSDVRAYDMDPAFVRGNAVMRKSGDPIHLMSLRIALDDSFTIVEALAVSHQTPYADCMEINATYEQLVGLRIEAGFSQAVKTRFRGVLGCTHLTELLGPMATTALQSIRPAMERQRHLQGLPPRDDGPRPALLNSCHGLRRGGEPAIMRWGAQVGAEVPPEER